MVIKFDLFIKSKILKSIHHQLDGKLSGMIYLGCGIGKLFFWDQIIGNYLINLVGD